jgi:hypothetical protein
MVFGSFGNMARGLLLENSVHERPSSSFDLIANNVLLKLANNTVVTYNCRGEQVRLLDDVRNDSNHSCFHLNVTRDKNFAIRTVFMED